MIVLYGIKNCDTMKKALQYLIDKGQEACIHDYRVDGISAEWLVQAEQAFGWQQLINKRSTTWRNLDEQQKQNLSKASVLELLQAQPTLIKRPIILQDKIALIGFNPDDYAQIANS